MYKGKRHTRARMHAHARARAHACARAHPHARTRTRTPTHAHALTRTRTHTHAHARTHKRTPTRTRAHCIMYYYIFATDAQNACWYSLKLVCNAWITTNKEIHIRGCRCDEQDQVRQPRPLSRCCQTINLQWINLIDQAVNQSINLSIHDQSSK